MPRPCLVPRRAQVSGVRNHPNTYKDQIVIFQGDKTETVLQKMAQGFSPIKIDESEKRSMFSEEYLNEARGLLEKQAKEEAEKTTTDKTTTDKKVLAGVKSEPEVVFQPISRGTTTRGTLRSAVPPSSVLPPLPLGKRTPPQRIWSCPPRARKRARAVLQTDRLLLRL